MHSLASSFDCKKCILKQKECVIRSRAPNIYLLTSVEYGWSLQFFNPQSTTNNGLFDCNHSANSCWENLKTPKSCWQHVPNEIPQRLNHLTFQHLEFWNSESSTNQKAALHCRKFAYHLKFLNFIIVISCCSLTEIWSSRQP